jgi:hypothetical protein
MAVQAKHETRRGPKYHLDIEGVGSKEWDRDTITTEELIALAGWEAGQQVVMVDQENVETTLAPLETINLKPGMGFGKKFRWKRG